MATITQIEIDGFKAFSCELHIEFRNRKEFALIRRERKRQIFIVLSPFMLYLQSVFKDDKGAKYFTPGSIVNGNLLQRMKSH